MDEEKATLILPASLAPELEVYKRAAESEALVKKSTKGTKSNAKKISEETMGEEMRHPARSSRTKAGTGGRHRISAV